MPMFTERAICELKRPSEGLNSFRNTPIFVRAHTVYDTLALIRHVIFRVADNI